MRKHNIILSLLFTFLLTSCGPALKSIYEDNYPLTSRRVFSRTGELSLKIPDGWHAVEDNEKNMFDIWIVKDNYESYMTLVPINLDEESKVKNGENRIKNLMNYSKYFKKIENPSKYSEGINEVFEINDRLFGAYEYKTGDNFKERVVVFDYKKTSFELSAVCDRTQVCDSLYLLELYNTQNSIITSIKE